MNYELTEKEKELLVEDHVELQKVFKANKEFFTTIGHTLSEGIRSRQIIAILALRIIKRRDQNKNDNVEHNPFLS